MEESEILEDWCLLPFDEHVMSAASFENWEESKQAEIEFEKEFIQKCVCLKKKFDKIEDAGPFGIELQKVLNGDIHVSENGVEILKKLGFSFSFSQIKKNA